jgi:hypothetical protein
VKDGTVGLPQGGPDVRGHATAFLIADQVIHILIPWNLFLTGCNSLYKLLRFTIVLMQGKNHEIFLPINNRDRPAYKPQFKEFLSNEYSIISFMTFEQI